MGTLLDSGWPWDDRRTMSYKEQARLTREACNVLTARLDSQKSCCEAMEHELLQRHSQRELLQEATAAGSCGNGNNNNKIKMVVKQGREIVDVSSCVSLRAAEGEDVEEEGEDEEKVHVLTAAMNRLSESSSDESDDDEGVDDSDEVYNLRRAHQQAAARKSLVRHAIKVAMQVEGTKEAMNSWGEGAHPVAKGESEYCDSDFADDEMSPALRLSRDENDVLLGVPTVSVLSEIRTLRTLRKPTRTTVSSVGDLESDFSVEAAVASAGESSLRSDQSKQDVVQKDVIMVQEKPNFQCVKQEYLDELLQHIRFQIPTSEVAITSEDHHGPPPYISEGHLDELLEQALRNHLERNDAKQQQQQQQQCHNHQSQDDSMESMDDEKVREIGKSNLDKWLQLLLFKDVESSTCSSPGRDTPHAHAAQIVSPRGLSHISVAAMRESLERATHQEFQGGEVDAERPGKGLWGAILRKLSSVKNDQSEPSVQSTSLALFEPKEDYHTTDEAAAQNLRLSSHEADIANAMISLLQRSSTSSPGRHELTTATLAEGRTSSTCTSSTVGDALPGWPGGITSCSDHAGGGVWKTDYQLHSMENNKRYFPKPLSDVDEISETESIDSPAPATTAPPQQQQLHRPKKRVSIKVAGFVQGWKSKSSKKGSSTEPSPQSE